MTVEYVSSIYVLNKENKTLMQWNEKQGAWLMPGGFGEDSEFLHETGKRETGEECGSEIGENLEFLGYPTFEEKVLDDRAELLPAPIFVVKQKLTNGKIVQHFIYLARTKNDTIVEKRFKAKWVDLDEVENLDTFVNVKMQVKFIKDNLDKFKVI